MAFKDVKLDSLTCIKKFEVSLQLANRAQIEKFKESSNVNLKST
jgi:hypothetical protein